MDPSLRVITGLPLAELWTDRGGVSAVRGERLAQADIVALLRTGPVQFVVAACSEHLRWIDLAGCYSFWKDEVQPHLWPPGEAISLDDFPGSYCYSASAWRHADPSVPPIVVLETSH